MTAVVEAAAPVWIASHEMRYWRALEDMACISLSFQLMKVKETAIQSGSSSQPLTA